MINFEQVFNCVIPYIHDVDDRNSISLVCRTLYKLDGITRKHVTVYVHYSPDPYRLSQRFPFIESLSLKGFPLDFHRRGTCTTWVKGIAVKFTCLKELQFRGLIVTFIDLETLARTLGKDLRVLKISECDGCWERGLVHVSKYCNQLRTLCLDGWGLSNAHEQGKWLHELALHNTVLESLHCKFKYDKYEVEDLTLLARKCSKSLVSLRIQPFSLSLLGNAFRDVVRLEDFSVGFYDRYSESEDDYVGFKLPPNMLRFGTYDLPVTLLKSLLPHGNQLRELNLQCQNRYTRPNCGCSLIKSCPNLEVLYTEDRCGDTGLQVIAQSCKKLRKLTHDGWVTYTGLNALAKGCTNLEYLKVRLTNMSNEAMECVGTHLRNLQKFSVISNNTYDIPSDNGVRAMLMGCSKLERLHISLYYGGLTDVGLGYIGKYGRNLKHLSLDCIGESDAGLLELSIGCPKLRKLRMKDCPFSEQAVATFMHNNHSLRFICVEEGRHNTVLRLIRPDFKFSYLNSNSNGSESREVESEDSCNLLATLNSIAKKNKKHFNEATSSKLEIKVMKKKKAVKERNKGCWGRLSFNILKKWQK